MVSLQPYTSKGHKYYRIVESRRVNGKPKPVLVKHLGTAENILCLLEEKQASVRLHSFQHGDVAALKHAADRLGITEIINHHATPTERGLDVGTSILLAAINRATHPTSKRAWGQWAHTTSLARLIPGLDPDQLTSQHFWDQMHALDTDALQRIEAALTHRITDHLDAKLDTLLYDITNFHTHIATTNKASQLAQRGKNKQRRNDLRQINVALLVARDSGIPLLTHTYQGNTADAKVFPDSLAKIRQRLQELGKSLQDVTLVYDRGNNSTANQAAIDASQLHYVAALSPVQNESLIPGPPEDGEELGEPFAGWRVQRFQGEHWGARRTFVLYRSQRLQEGQVRGLHQHISKAADKLQQWHEILAKSRAGPRSDANAQKRIDEILAAQHLKHVFKVTYASRQSGSDRLQWKLDEKQVHRLEEKVFGLRLLMTDWHAWSSEEIIAAYHAQSDVERVFRDWKDDRHFALRPQYHWTDSKLRVHVFICLLAYQLVRVVEHEARKLGWQGSMQGLLDELAKVRLAVVAHRTGKRGRPRTAYMLEDQPVHALDLYRGLVPGEAPFVYTAEGAI